MQRGKSQLNHDVNRSYSTRAPDRSQNFYLTVVFRPPYNYSVDYCAPTSSGRFCFRAMFVAPASCRLFSPQIPKAQSKETFMSSLSEKDRVSLCSFTFSDGRRCRTPRTGKNPHFCFDHAQKEARARAAQKLGKDLTYFFSGDYLSACDLSTALGRLIPAVVRADVNPRTARTVAYLAQTPIQPMPLSSYTPSPYPRTPTTGHARAAHPHPPAPAPPPPPLSPPPAPDPLPPAFAPLTPHSPPPTPPIPPTRPGHKTRPSPDPLANPNT